MSRYLFILRHAEAEPGDGVEDIHRSLNRNGINSVAVIGGRLQAAGERLDRIYSSPATRTEQTVRRLCPYLDYPESHIVWEPDLYLASQGDLLGVLTQCPSQCNRLMLVGHNPGLQNLLSYLLPNEKSAAVAGSLPTAAVAKLEILADDWRELPPCCGRLLYLHKP
jgi:phosphohistidine phosphatase